MGLFGSKNEMQSTIKVNYKGDKAEKGLSSLKKTVATVITVEALRRVAVYTKDLAKMGAQADVVNRSFEQFAERGGKNTEDMMQRMRTATMGMMSDMELQQKAMKAMIAGVSFDDIVTSLEFVSKFAITTGDDLNTRMQTIFTGLARGSALMFDDVGIMVSKSKDVVRDAVDQMREKMGQFNVSVEDATVKAGMLSAELKNQAAAIGKELIPVYDAIISKTVEWLPKVGDLTVNLIRMNKALFTSTTLQDVAVERMIDIAKETENATMLFDERVKKLKEISELEEKIGNQRKFLAQDQANMSAGMVRTITATMELNKKRLSELKGQAESLRVALKGLAGGGDKPKGKKAEEGLSEKEQKEMEALFRSFEEEELRRKKEANDKSNDQFRKAIEEKKKIEEEYRQMSMSEDEKAQEERLSILDRYAVLYPEKEKEINALRKQAQDEYNADRLKEESDALMEVNMLRLEINSNTIEGEFELKRELLNRKYAELIEVYGSNEQLINEILKSYEIERTKIEKEESDKRIEQSTKEKLDKINNARELIDGTQSILSAISKIQTNATNYQLAELEREYEGRKLSEKQQEEFEQRKTDIMREGARKQHRMAIFIQATALAESTALATAAIIKASEKGAQKGGVYAAVAEGAAMAAQMAVFVSMLAAAPKPPRPGFQTGRLGDERRSRQIDTIDATLGLGESVIPAPQTSQNRDVVQSVIDNTINTEQGRSNSGGGGTTIINNYSVTTEQLLQSQIQANRRNAKGLKR